jgi:tRNA C32,U32 (ribose-2'-O)-methylase TrmJ
MYELGRRERITAEEAEGPQRARRRGEKPAPLKPALRLRSGQAGAAPRRGMREEFAEMETVERIGEALLEALRKSGYIAPRGEAKAEEKLRRMLRRFSLETGDAEVFLGMVRKILWKLDQDG